LIVAVQNDVVSSSGCLRGRLTKQEMGNIWNELVLPLHRLITFGITDFWTFSIVWIETELTTLRGQALSPTAGL